tara:strand:- start:70 stop:309 length:240 start_codon:yes stop_codon:yes gene_type:complete
VTKVELTPNLKIAKIYFSIFNHDKSYKVEKITNYLNAEKKNIRFKMGKSLQSKYVPGINFYYDDQFSIYDKINKILKDD